MKEIIINSKKFGTHTVLLDDEDYEYLNQWKWHITKGRDTFYACRNVNDKDGKRRPIKMHRVVLGLTDSKIEVDHIDGNGLNQQRNNLRAATRFQNATNRRANKNSTSKYLGVCRYKRDQNWSAQIKKDQHKNHLGYYENEEDAALAYNKAAIEYFGEFAKLNKITA